MLDHCDVQCHAKNPIISGIFCVMKNMPPRRGLHRFFDAFL
jgi:hypothetical protein